MTFLETLAQQGVINRYQIDDIVSKAAELGGNIDESLRFFDIDSGLVRDAKAEYYQVPAFSGPVDKLSADILQIIPEDSARTYQSIPVGKTPEGVIQVGMLDPGNLEASNAMQFIFNQAKMPYSVSVISYDDFEKVSRRYANFGSTAISSVGNKDASRIPSAASDEIEDLEKIIENTDGAEGGQDDTIFEDAPISKTVGIILRNAIDNGVSDIHIEHTANNVSVRYRVDGDLHTTYTLPVDARRVVVARVKILAKLRLDEKRKPQDGRFFAKVDGRKVDFRVSTMPTFFGEKVVIRILDPGNGLNTIEKTGMNIRHLEMIKRAAARPYGMILITGPTGSGKSTTLYSLLQEVDRNKKNVVSLEDPIEYNISGVNQSQVRPEIGFTFASGLRSVLRQDPDVIMVGEIRDKETAALAVQAALTGHLVISTLHTNTAIGAIPRLIDMGVDPYLIAPTLIMLVGQRLARRIAPGRGIEKPIEPGIRAFITEQFKDLPEEFRNELPLTDTVFEAQASPEGGTGTRGRVAVFEMLEVDDDIERLILDSPQEQDIYKFARQRGMLTMRDDAVIKCMQGLIPWSEVNKL